MSSSLFALLAMCSIVCSSQASPIEKPTDAEEYRLRIHESGEVFSEMLTIDEKEQTELLKVPAHGNIEKSNIMFDFKMNATMIHFPLKDLCFLLPLTRSQPTPRNLAANLHQVTSDEVTTHKETVRIGKEISDRSILSGSTARLCSKSQIFRVTEIPSGVDVTSMNTPDLRRARSLYEQCEDGLTIQLAATACPMNFKAKCRVEYLSCAWLIDCPQLFGIHFKNNREAALNYIRVAGQEDNCRPTHQSYSIVCCGYYCNV